MSLLNEKMDRITREATMLASSDSTRSFRRGKIQDGCMAVKEELQQLSDVLLSQVHYWIYEISYMYTNC